MIARVTALGISRAGVGIAAKLRDVRFVRYLLASIGALAADVATFLALLSLGLTAAAASAIGYSLGIVTHWLLSSRIVFIGDVATGGRERTRQKALFVASALLGLLITTTIVSAGVAGGMDTRLAKGVAILASFAATWLVRSRIVFRTQLAGERL